MHIDHTNFGAKYSRNRLYAKKDSHTWSFVKRDATVSLQKR